MDCAVMAEPDSDGEERQRGDRTKAGNVPANLTPAEKPAADVASSVSPEILGAIPSSSRPRTEPALTEIMVSHVPQVHGIEDYKKLGFEVNHSEIPEVSPEESDEHDPHAEVYVLLLIDTGITTQQLIDSLGGSGASTRVSFLRGRSESQPEAGGPKWISIPQRILDLACEEKSNAPQRPMENPANTPDRGKVQLDVDFDGQVRVERLPRKTLITDDPHVLVGNSLGDSEYMIIYVNPLDKEHFYVILAPRSDRELMD